MWLKAGLLGTHHVLLPDLGAGDYIKENKVKADRVYFRSVCLKEKHELWLLLPRESPGKKDWYVVRQIYFLSSGSLAASRSFKPALVKTRELPA